MAESTEQSGVSEEQPDQDMFDCEDDEAVSKKKHRGHRGGRRWNGRVQRSRQQPVPPFAEDQTLEQGQQKQSLLVLGKAKPQAEFRKDWTEESSRIKGTK